MKYFMVTKNEKMIREKSENQFYNIVATSLD